MEREGKGRGAKRKVQRFNLSLGSITLLLLLLLLLLHSNDDPSIHPSIHMYLSQLQMQKGQTAGAALRTCSERGKLRGSVDRSVACIPSCKAAEGERWMSYGARSDRVSDRASDLSLSLSLSLSICKVRCARPPARASHSSCSGSPAPTPTFQPE